MHGIVFDIKRFSIHDGPGVRTTVFFKGCPLSCIWCHNPESQSKSPVTITESYGVNGTNYSMPKTYGVLYEPEALMKEILKDKDLMTQSGGGVTFSGGEPLLQHAFLLEMLERCQSAGIHTVVDTSGFCKRQSLMDAAKNTDLFLYDIKLADRAKHIEFTNTSNEPIFKNLKALRSAQKPVWLRIPLIPGINSSVEMQLENIRVLSDLDSKCYPVFLLPFNRAGFHKYKNLQMKNMLIDVMPLSSGEMEAICNLYITHGFNATIGSI